MLIRADAIELAILKFLIEWHDDAGWQGYQGDIEAIVRRLVNDASAREVIESLILLHSQHLVGIWRHESGTWVPYNPEEGSTYFYNGDFRCKPLPGSSRRQQKLSKQNRQGAFVSHFGPESPIAVHLKQFMLASLAPPIPVFVSSDYDSIPSGQWYSAILAGLKQSEVIICLLSPVSVDRRWLNFEGGFGFGSEAEVIPLVWGQLTKEQIGMPLGQLQARALKDSGDIKAMTMATSDPSWCSRRAGGLSSIVRVRVRPCSAAQKSKDCCAAVFWLAAQKSWGFCAPVLSRGEGSSFTLPAKSIRTKKEYTSPSTIRHHGLPHWPV